ncbi:MAG: hypothetical protein KDK72_06595 [Chlamydiia bacterium]|nr:hypothetical protein [Chlamydiia bacterium]
MSFLTESMTTMTWEEMANCVDWWNTNALSTPISVKVAKGQTRFKIEKDGRKYSISAERVMLKHEVEIHKIYLTYRPQVRYRYHLTISSQPHPLSTIKAVAARVSAERHYSELEPRSDYEYLNRTYPSFSRTTGKAITWKHEDGKDWEWEWFIEDPKTSGLVSLKMPVPKNLAKMTLKKIKY